MVWASVSVSDNMLHLYFRNTTTAPRAQGAGGLVEVRMQHVVQYGGGSLYHSLVFLFQAVNQVNEVLVGLTAMLHQ